MSTHQRLRRCDARTRCSGALGHVTSRLMRDEWACSHYERTILYVAGCSIEFIVPTCIILSRLPVWFTNNRAINGRRRSTSLVDFSFSSFSILLNKTNRNYWWFARNILFLLSFDQKFEDSSVNEFIRLFMHVDPVIRLAVIFFTGLSIN